MKTNISKIPWAQSIHDDNGDIVVRDADGNIIANCTTDSNFLSGKTQMANADLIAAAPAMLEYLKELDLRSRMKLPVRKDLILIMRALIAKAEGK